MSGRFGRYKYDYDTVNPLFTRPQRTADEVACDKAFLDKYRPEGAAGPAMYNLVDRQA